MSARQWKLRLEECQRKLGDATIAAKEWRLVANNRLDILHRVDEALLYQLRALEGVSEIFGVKAEFPKEAWTSASGMDGNQTAMYCLGRMEAISLYLKDLVGEAASIQVTLNDTYQLACDALEVSRPLSDTTVVDDLGLTEIPASPLSALLESVNNCPPPQSTTERMGTKDYKTDNLTAPALGPAGALALFQPGGVRT